MLAIVVAGVCYEVNARVLGLVLGDRSTSGFTVDEATSRGIGGRIFGAFTTLLLPSYGDFGVGSILLVVGGVCAVTAAVIVRRRPDDRDGALLFASVSVACFAVRLLVPATPVPGIVWAFPLIAVAAVLVSGSFMRRPVVAVLGGASVLFGAAVLATQYTGGGTHEWGWRYFAMAVPVVVALAVPAVDAAARERLRDEDRRRLSGLLLASLLLLSVLGVLSLRAAKEDNARTVAGVRATYAATPAVDGGKPVVVTTQWGTVDRFSWRTIDETRWLVVAPDRVNQQLDGVLDRVAGLGVGQLTFVTTDPARDLPFVQRHGTISATRALPDDGVAWSVQLR